VVREISPGSTIVVGGHVSAIPGIENLIDADHIVKGDGIAWMREYLGEDPSAPIRHPALDSGFDLRIMGLRIPDRLDASATIIASMFNGKRLNSPNDVVPHTDGSYWFTDPPYGAQFYEGTVDDAGGPANKGGRLNSRLGQPPEFGSYKRELPTAVYRVDKSGTMTQVAGEDTCPDPNGLCFSPDFKKLYVISTGQGPGDTIAGGKGDMHVYDVGSDNKLSNHKLFSDFMIDGVKCGPDGVRADVDGNLWCSSNAGRAVGYSGVTVWNPAGKLIGRIRLPEICGNVCFGGPKRNRLFMAASQSLYAVYTGTQGASPG